MKIYYLIWLVLTAVILYDGFGGEFSAPMISDALKWAAWFAYSVVLLFVRRKKA